MLAGVGALTLRTTPKESIVEFNRAGWGWHADLFRSGGVGVAVGGFVAKKVRDPSK